ncbi:MAG: hypothetical protein AAF196_06060 [Planctomycetota bacterium]
MIATLLILLAALAGFLFPPAGPAQACFAVVGVALLAVAFYRLLCWLRERMRWRP